MQRIIIRKRIDRRILALVLAGVVALPLIGTRVIYELRYWHECRQTEREILRGDRSAAGLRLDRLTERYGLRPDVLALVCDLQLEAAKRDGDVQKLQRVLAASAWIEKIQWRRDPRLDYWRGWTARLAGAGHEETAYAALRRWQQAGHPSLEVSEALYALALSTRRFAEAEAEAETLARLDPTNAAYPLRKAEVALAMGERVRAKVLLRDLVFQAAPTGESARHRARMLIATLRELRLPEEVEFVYTWLVERSGRDPEWVASYGLWLVEQNQIPKARNMLWLAVLSNQTNQPLRDALAKTL